MNLIAQQSGGSLSGEGPLGTPGASAGQTIANVISAAVGLMTVIAGVYFLFIILSGAIGIISAGGDKGTYEEARKKITSGAIGFTIAVAAIFILGILGTLLNIPGILDISRIMSF